MGRATKQIADAYLTEWKAVLTNLLGWSEERVERWAWHRYRDGLSGHDIWFTHTAPLEYVSYLLVPESVRRPMDWLEFMRFEDKLYLPWQMTLYLSTGLLTGVVVSLYTTPVDEKKLEHFYALIRTPITPGERVNRPCTLPEGAVVPEKRQLLPHTNFEFLVPSKTSVVGFLLGWACVAALVYVVYSIASV